MTEDSQLPGATRPLAGQSPVLGPLSPGHGISRVRQDTAGGVILGDGQDFVTVEGTPWAVLGDAVAPHGITPHAAPVMAEGSSFVRIDGLPACRAGNKATCGHAATGSAFMRISE